MSGLFGKKAVRGAGSHIQVLSTGKHIDDIVSTLIKQVNDPDPDVSVTISEGLRTIGLHEPELLLSSCLAFLSNKSNKTPIVHRVKLLKSMKEIVSDSLNELPEDLCLDLISFSAADMVTQKDISPEWQGSASSLLVLLGKRFPGQVMEQLIRRFESGQVPHYFVVKTLGDVADAVPMLIVPKLNEVFARILPILGMIKHENQKWVFATSIGHFCDAITHYSENIEEAHSQYTTDSFSSQVFACFEIIYQHWLNSREQKVRLTCLESIGHMVHILNESQLSPLIVELVERYIGFYKTEKSTAALLPVTRGLSHILEVGTVIAKHTLEEHVPNFLLSLHPVVCAPVDFEDPNSIKNSNEILRVFEMLSRAYTDRVLNFLMQKLDDKEPNIRRGTLVIFKHLINAMDQEFEHKREFVISGLKPLTRETNLRTKKVLAQTIVVMAGRDYLSREGGATLLEFIVSGASTSDEEQRAYQQQTSKMRNLPPDAVSPVQFRSVCEHILKLMASTIVEMEDVMWPYLFEVVCPGEFAAALPAVCKSISEIAERKRANEESDSTYWVDFDKNRNLPKPAALVARLLVQLTSPKGRGDPGLSYLACLQQLGPILHPAVVDLWDTTLPKLSKYLEVNSFEELWKPETWFGLCYRLLSETLLAIDDEDFTSALGDSLMDQYKIFEETKNFELKATVSKFMGKVLEHCNRKDYVRAKLNIMYSNVNKNNSIDRAGLSEGLGNASAKHLDIVLDKIEDWYRELTAVKPSTGFFSRSSGPKKSDVIAFRSTVVMTYGHIVSCANTDLIISRLETQILNKVKPLFKEIDGTMEGKESIVNCIELISKALSPEHLGHPYVLKERDELLRMITKYMDFSSYKTKKKPTEIPAEIRVKGLVAASSLVSLEPRLSAKETDELLSEAVSIYVVTMNMKDDKAAGLILQNFNGLLSAILRGEPTIAMLNRLLGSLEEWTTKNTDSLRERSVRTIGYILYQFVQLMSKDNRPDGVLPLENRFENLGHWIGVLAPRLTDPVPAVRKTVAEAFELLFRIEFTLGSGEMDEDQESSLSIVSSVRDKLYSADESEQFNLVSELASSLAGYVPVESLPDMLQYMFQYGVTDERPSSANGCAVLLNSFIVARGSELESHVEELVRKTIASMDTMTSEQTLNGTLHGVKTLAVHHLMIVVSTLLSTPIPFSKNVVKSFQAISREESVSLDLLQHLCKLMNNSDMFETEKNTGKGKKNKNKIQVHARLPRAATCALAAVLDSGAVEDLVSESFAPFIATILLRLGTANGLPEAEQEAVNALKALLGANEDEALLAHLDKVGVWSKLKSPNYYEGIGIVAKALSKVHEDEMPDIFNAMMHYINRPYIGQRISATMVASALVSYDEEDEEEENTLSERAISTLIARLHDEDYGIQARALEGLSNLSKCSEEKIFAFGGQVTSSIISSLDSPNDLVVKAALSSLDMMIEVCSEEHVTPLMNTIFMALKSLFVHDKTEFCQDAFQIMGTLSRFGDNDTYFEQVHNNLVNIMIFINDESPSLQKSIKKTLRLAIPYLGFNDTVVDLVNSSKCDPNRSMNYESFMKEFLQQVVESSPERLNFYLSNSINFQKHDVPRIRSNAIIFAGTLVYCLPEGSSRQVNIEQASTSISELLVKDKSPDVRRAAAKSLSFFYNV